MDQNVMAIQTAILTISTASSNLDSVLRALTPDPKGVQQFDVAIMGVESALTQARTDIIPTQPVSIVDGLTLQNAADTMVKSLKIMFMSSILQRQTLDQLGVTPVLLKSYMTQTQLSDVLGQYTGRGCGQRYSCIQRCWCYSFHGGYVP
ncbi:uncharacterized protein LY79DRAFT_672356 [Colletotrichum navitas]|uniref:Uncharacterized protein n=1 Tax=Colletotrichum navitas TaxID=681940 RepID=A0AAD8V2G4_9PEZI|nr:uncharacterized protein LY79DRAFT_672356 [Colletotrichum navitas]KAK1579714.1 hypothetical protein LY79DRAFT_672356 [Colletotrichum navitas]